MNQQVIFDGSHLLASLKDALEKQFALHPDKPPEEIAQMLGLSEAQLLAAACGDRVTRLACNRAELLADLACLGPVRAITGNRYAEQQQMVEYRRLRLTGERGLRVTPELELELDFANWHYAFAISGPASWGLQPGLHFFDSHGNAVHRVVLSAASDAFAYRLYVSTHRAVDQRPEILVPPVPVFAIGHHVGKQGGCGRTMPASLFRELLHSLVDVDLSISFSVGNPGAVQTWHGTLDAIRCEGDKLRLLAADYTLNLNETQIAGARLPCRAGTVEVYDAEGAILATLAGPPPHREAQAEAWRRILAALPINAAQPGCRTHA